MTKRLVDMRINRVSLVRRPANRRRLLFKSAYGDDDEIELAKALEMHLGGILDAIGEADDPERAARIENLINLMEDGGDETVNRLLAFLRTAQELKFLLASVVKADEEHPDDDEEGQDDENQRYPDAAWWRMMERKIRNLNGPIVEKDDGKEESDMTNIENPVTVALDGGFTLTAGERETAHVVILRALGITDPSDAMENMARLKKSQANPEFNALYRAHEWLEGEKSLAPGWEPTMKEFAQSYPRLRHRRWA